MTSDRGQAIIGRIAALPEGTWRSCPRCEAWLHRDRLARSRGVCSGCGHHFRLSARERIATLVDPGSAAEHDADLAAGDPLGFVDRVAYPERLLKARKTTGLSDAVVVATATVGGHPLVLAVLDFAFLGGSMGSAVGEKVARAAELARTRRVPLVTICSSGGARMQEGILSLLQMAKTAAAVAGLRRAGIPFVSVLTDPVYGGVAASFAALGDVIVAEAGTRAGFAGPGVIEQTIRQTLPAGFQTAEFLCEHGHIDAVVERAALPGLLRNLLSFFAATRSGHLPDPPDSAPLQGTGVRDAWEAVRLARAPGRPNALAYIDAIFSGFLPLAGDRSSEDDPAVVGGFARLDGVPVIVVAHCKGRDTAENVRRNFGMPHPSGYRKARRLFGLAERFGVPVVTLVDTPGAYPGIRAEEDNQSGAIAETLAMAATLRTPIVCVVTGEGGSGGALALATGDRLLMQENAVYSVISPEGCATILFGDAARAPEAARALAPRAVDLLRLGIVDELVAEPPGGAHTDPALAAAAVADALRRQLRDLLVRDVDDIVAARALRLRSFASTLLPSRDAARSADEWQLVAGDGRSHG